MTRMSKQSIRRASSPRKRRPPSAKTGAKKDNLSKGFKEHANGAEGIPLIFIPKMK